MKIKVGGVYITKNGGLYTVKSWDKARRGRRRPSLEQHFYAEGKTEYDWLVFTEDGFPAGWTKKDFETNPVLKEYTVVKEINILNT